MKVFVSLISLSSQNTVSREERQAETATEIGTLFTENIDLFLDSSSTESWLDDLAIFDTTPDFGLLGEIFDTTTGVFSFIVPTTASTFPIIPTTVPVFELPSTTQSNAELVNFTTDIGNLLLENTPWPELQTTTESLDDLLAELATDSPFDLISGTELPADLLDLILGTTQSPLIDLFTVPDDIELPVATTVETLIENESTTSVAATSSTPVTAAPISVNETTKVSTTVSETPATSKSITTTQKSMGTSSAVGSTSTVESTPAATESPAVSEDTPAAEEVEPEAAVTEAAIASSTISNTSSAKTNTNETTTAVPSTTAPEPEPEPGNTTTPDSTTARPDTTTPAVTDTTTSSASQLMLSAFVIFIVALFQ